MFTIDYKSIIFGFKNGKEIKVTNVNGIDPINDELVVYLFENWKKSIQIYLDEIAYIIEEVGENEITK